MSSRIVSSIASIEDLETICALLRAQFAEHALELGETRLRAGVEGLLGNPERGVVILARDEGQAVGLALLSHAWTVEHGGLVAWLEELYVLPERRENGIGAELLRRAIAVARERACLAIDLEVDEGHARAAHLYRRAAFRPLARTHWTLSLVEPLPHPEWQQSG